MILECIRSDKKGPLQKLLVLHIGITNEQKDKISNQEAEISQQEERKRGLLTEIECLKRRIKDAGRTRLMVHKKKICQNSTYRKRKLRKRC
jgi:hypothetical protein